MEVTYNELYNSTNQATNLYSVQVEYIGPFGHHKTLNHSTRAHLHVRKHMILLKQRGHTRLGK